jgi:hypothetical protein
VALLRRLHVYSTRNAVSQRFTFIIFTICMCKVIAAHTTSTTSKYYQTYALINRGQWLSCEHIPALL